MNAMNATSPTLHGVFPMHGRKLRVLMAEGEPARISKALRSLFPDEESELQLTVVSTVSVLLPTIQLVGPEILFLDLSISGPDALATVRAVHRAAPSLPLITLGSSTEKLMAEGSLREGAQDFLLKDIADAKAVERVLRTALERNTVAGLADLLRDDMTALYNQDGFQALAAKYLQLAQRSDGQLVLISVRIKNLGALNTEFGPSGADSAIKEVAELLKGSFRRTDPKARLSAGDFAVLAADAAEPSVAIIRQRLETRLAACNRAREPWGTIELGITAEFWSSRAAKKFSEIMDSAINMSGASKKLLTTAAAVTEASCGE